MCWSCPWMWYVFRFYFRSTSYWKISYIITNYVQVLSFRTLRPPLLLHSVPQGCQEGVCWVCIKPGRGKTQPASPNMCIIWWSGSSFVDMCNMGSILLYSTPGPLMCSQIYFVGVTRVTYFMSFEGATVMSSWTILTFPRHLGCST